jgi:hypothetical protein
VTRLVRRRKHSLADAPTSRSFRRPRTGCRARCGRRSGGYCRTGGFGDARFYSAPQVICPRGHAASPGPATGASPEARAGTPLRRRLPAPEFWRNESGRDVRLRSPSIYSPITKNRLARFSAARIASRQASVPSRLRLFSAPIFCRRDASREARVTPCRPSGPVRTHSGPACRGGSRARSKIQRRSTRCRRRRSSAGVRYYPYC